ncbi:hypothetical protein PHYBOEH_002000 [Phytophthora boehmeriae]|uniref:Kinesin motor domain-containing protein n=1 Tax=Phytophthora boehmeriae TaxID=109152 RepID=A0A8T1WT34_9STRA|nr:hypothetical protein PHYBOEH_002000 [Phytophthora boehmeriae]
MTAEGRRDRAEEQDSVKVCVRIRPLSSKEKQEQTKSCIRIAASVDGLSNSNAKSSHDSLFGKNKEPQQLIVGKDRAFTFDNILGVTTSQLDTYKTCVEPLVQGFLEGYNATVLAYGQTGTGKTHTMAGSGYDARGSEKNGELQGIIPRVIKAVFKELKDGEGNDNQQRGDHSLRVEYVEIYNEELRDLLHPETTSKQLAIREDGEGNIVIAGVASERADTQEAVFRHLVVGGSSRATGSTLMNEQSSRSHAIFSLLLEQRDGASGARRFSKFHLVDLAGSERAKRTGAVAGRFKESVNINQGLLALGNVISALSDDKRRIGTAGNGNTIVHVPYRDSKLTRLLQDSLGGNSRTLMIACVSPASVNFEETLNTLNRTPSTGNSERSVQAKITSSLENVAQGKSTTTPTSRSSSVSSSKPLSSSRGLFTGRSGTLYDGNEDRVVMGNPDEDGDVEESSMLPALAKSRSGSAGGFKRHGVGSRGDGSRTSLNSASRPKTNEAIAKLEHAIAILQAKLEELQKKNEELLDAREESTRRWSLERQNYERQLGEAEHSIEALKRENQSLEDSILEDKRADSKDQVARNSILSKSRSGPNVDAPKSSIEHTRPDTAASAKSSRPSTGSKSQSNGPVDETIILSTFESSVRQLIEYHVARREVLHLLKGKKDAEQSRNEAARRVNALEMQKMRQSLGVRESISDLSESLHVLDERMQAESRSLEELERLKKLRGRAEQKLGVLRKQEEEADFLDNEAKQELQDLEELLVDLDSHVAFQDAELETARKDLMAIKQRRDSASKSPLEGLASELIQQLGLSDLDPATAATSFMGKCLNEVARLRMRVSDMGNEVQELQNLLKEREAALGQLESGLSVARGEFDRRLAAQRQESALAMEQLKRMQPQVLVHTSSEGDTGSSEPRKDGELQKMIVRCQKKDEYIADLEKHLVFYKSKAKQMQAQLQQLIRTSSEHQRSSGGAQGHSEDEQDNQLQRRIQQLEDANDALMKDLATAKVYLRSSQSRGSISRTSGGSAAPKVVRVSRSELRELPTPPAPPSHVADSRE